MRYLNGKEIIDSALTVLKNNSTPIRTKMLTWLNVMAAKLEVERAWTFLGNKSATLTPASNVITLPSDYGTFDTLRADGLFLTPSHRLTEYEAWQADNSSSGASAPVGFTEGTYTYSVYAPPNTNVATARETIFDGEGIAIIKASGLQLPAEYTATDNGRADVPITVPTDITYIIRTLDVEPAIYQNQIIIAMPTNYTITSSPGLFRITNSEVESRPLTGDIMYIIISFAYDYSEITTATNSTITMHGANITSSVQLGYTVQPALFADTVAPSSWPNVCLPLFIRGLLDAFYEYDMDERAANSYSFNQVELSKLKAWDNLHKPKSQPNRHGYRRTR